MDTSFEDRYKKLNTAQKKAVDTIDGPVMVVAGPGSGKTELLSLRVGNILKQGTARAYNILCLTFTETAAHNMRARLESLIGPDAYRVAIYTFHGFCTDIIGRYPEYFYNAVHVQPASDLLQSELLASIVSQHFGWAMMTDLHRVINTEHQAGLNRQQRLKNLDNAFVYSGPSLEGKHILLVDDVVTTGTTLQSVTEALLPSEPVAIWALAVARNREKDEKQKK
jgi:superfamily I DNA/RNA helicase